MLGRLTKALDRARAAGALTNRLPIHLTEFGIQSTPDTTSGVSLAKQVEYRAIAERHRVRQPARRLVLAVPPARLRPRSGRARRSTRGFESGLRFADGKPKPSLPAFRLPLAVRRVGSKASIWGLVRPATGVTTATITYANRGSSRFLPLRNVTTNAFGYFSLRSSWRAGRRWNVTWQGQTGSPVGSYTR